MSQYGNVGEKYYPISSWVWGHRINSGQHWMEYLLEFLNVLVGFNYELGQGISVGSDKPIIQSKYKYFTRLGLRRFVFYKRGYEKKKSPLDDRAQERILEGLRQQAEVKSQLTSDDPILVARDLLSAFSAVEEARSWYAKSLFPANEKLLFWQGDKNTGKKDPNKKIPKTYSESDLDIIGEEDRTFDTTVTFSKRNFFARGGEIYYLMLSAGTEENLSRRKGISETIRFLLQENNRPIGHIAEAVEKTWEASINNPSQGNAKEISKEFELGWIPDPKCSFYNQVAQDLETFLKSKLDTLESLDLLAHLICFHTILYIYHRALSLPKGVSHSDGNCAEDGRPKLLISVMESNSDTIIQKKSASIFREHDQYQNLACVRYLKEEIGKWVQEAKLEGGVELELAEKVKSRFKNSLKNQNKIEFELRSEELVRALEEGNLDEEAFIVGYAEMLQKIFSGDFRKQFKGVHKKLAKHIGFVSPKSGPGGHFVLGDNLLKALVMANIAPGSPLTFDQFLSKLYKNYGLVIGPQEAKESGLFDKLRIDAEYYDRNRLALLVKLQQAGLAESYSDATAIVKVDSSMKGIGAI